MVTTTTTASVHRPRQSPRALVLAGGILFVIGFGGPILLTAGVGHASSCHAQRA